MSLGLLRDFALPVTKDPEDVEPEIANGVVAVASEEVGADNVPITCVVNDLVVGILRISVGAEVLRAGKPALADNRVVENTRPTDNDEVATLSTLIGLAMSFAPRWMASSFAPRDDSVA